MALVPEVRQLAAIDVLEFAVKLSSQLSLEELLDMSSLIERHLSADPDLAGVVVTHGTGTMEESSFFADLVIDDDRPIVFTGAMRGGPGHLSDGPVNLLDAVKIAVDKTSRERGVLVAMNGEVHTARRAVKRHTLSSGAFDSGEFGPLAVVYPDKIAFGGRVRRSPTIKPTTLVTNVDLIKFVVGMDDRYVQTSIAAGASAIVLEGSGLGNLNDLMAEGVETAIESGVHVVLCSRASYGRTFASYGTAAGSASLAQRGCLFSSLPGPKARIFMILALGVTRSSQRLQELLDACD